MLELWRDRATFALFDEMIMMINDDVSFLIDNDGF
jgi:hypothetical protein